MLREIGADAVPSCLVLNKMDRLGAAGRAALVEKHPGAIMLAAHAPEDVLALPYAQQGLISEIYDSVRVLSEDYDENGQVLKVRGLPGAIARLQRSLAAQGA